MSIITENVSPPPQMHGNAGIHIPAFEAARNNDGNWIKYTPKTPNVRALKYNIKRGRVAGCFDGEFEVVSDADSVYIRLAVA